MSENPLPTAFPTRQAAAIPGRSRRGAVTGKLKTGPYPQALIERHRSLKF
jgi:hypothetical protein